MTLSRGFLLSLLALLVVTLLGTSLAWRNSTKERIDQLRADRYRFSLGSLRSAAESGLKLGLETGELPGIQTLIADARALQRDIIAIDVFDVRGRVTLSSDRAGLGTSEPAEWREPCLAARGEILASRDSDSEVQCAALLNAYEQVVGGIALRYKAMSAPVLSGVIASAQSSDAALGDALRNRVLLTVLGIPLALLALGGALGAWVSRSIGQQLDAAQGAIQSGHASGALPLLGPVSPALQALQARSDQMAKLDAELEAIDQLGTH
jgi:hypothetical protein